MNSNINTTTTTTTVVLMMRLWWGKRIISRKMSLEMRLKSVGFSGQVHAPCTSSRLEWDKTRKREREKRQRRIFEICLLSINLWFKKNEGNGNIDNEKRRIGLRARHACAYTESSFGTETRTVEGRRMEKSVRLNTKRVGQRLRCCCRSSSFFSQFIYCVCAWRSDARVKGKRVPESTYLCKKKYSTICVFANARCPHRFDGMQKAAEKT